MATRTRGPREERGDHHPDARPGVCSDDRAPQGPRRPTRTTPLQHSQASVMPCRCAPPARRASPLPFELLPGARRVTQRQLRGILPRRGNSSRLTANFEVTWRPHSRAPPAAGGARGRSRPWPVGTGWAMHQRRAAGPPWTGWSAPRPDAARTAGGRWRPARPGPSFRRDRPAGRTVGARRGRRQQLPAAYHQRALVIEELAEGVAGLGGRASVQRGQQRHAVQLWSRRQTQPLQDGGQQVDRLDHRVHRPGGEGGG
jgi:hypothetical protein